jgi:hypothetical protein
MEKQGFKLLSMHASHSQNLILRVWCEQKTPSQRELAEGCSSHDDEKVLACTDDERVFRVSEV